MNKTTVVTATTTVPAESSLRSLAIVTGTPVPATTPSTPAQQAVTRAKSDLAAYTICSGCAEGPSRHAGVRRGMLRQRRRESQETRRGLDFGVV